MAQTDDDAFWAAFFGEASYYYWLKGPKRVLKMPSQAQVQIERDQDEGCILNIWLPGMEGGQLLFYAFQASYAWKDLSAYPDEEIVRILSAPQAQPAGMAIERFGEIAPGKEAVWVEETPLDARARSLMVFDQGWVFVVTVLWKQEAPLPDEAQGKQQRLLRSLFEPDGEVSNSWLVDGRLISLPAPFLLHQWRNQAGEGDSASLFIDETGQLMEIVRLSVLPLNAEEADNLDMRQVLSDKLPEFNENSQFVKELEDAPDILSFDAGNGRILCTINQGRVLVAAENIYQDKSKDWQGDFALAAMNVLLGRAAAWPLRLPRENAPF